MNRRWVALVFLSVGAAMIILDSTIVNITLPAMIADLGLSASEAEWVSVAYLLSYASLLILFGRLADRHGRKLIFILGVVVFSSASIAVAASSTSSGLICARVVQGIGGAMIIPSALSSINAIFSGKSRAVAFAVWGGTVGGVAALGPIVGGWLTTNATWHWAFLINVPLAIAVVIGAAIFVPETKERSGPQGIDPLGTVLVTLGLLGILFALVGGSHYGWVRTINDLAVGPWAWPLASVSVVDASAVVGVLAIGGLLWLELRRLRAGKAVVINLRLFRIRSFAAGNAVGLVVNLGEFGLLFALPLFLQSVRHFDAVHTGAVLVWLALGCFLAASTCAPLAHRYGPVWVLRGGMVLIAVGILGIGLTISATVEAWQVAAWLFVYGLGVGFSVAQLTGVILADVPVAESGQASAVQSTARQIGAAMGTAIIGTTVILGLGTTSDELELRGVPRTQAEQVDSDVSGSVGQDLFLLQAQPNGEVLLDGASAAFTTAVKAASIVSGAFVLLGLATTFLLPANASRVKNPSTDATKDED